MPVLDFFLNDISPVTKNLRFDIGATLPVLRVRVMDGNDPVSLAGGTATFTMRDKDGIAKILNAPAIIEGDGTSGIVQYPWTLSDTNDARIFFAQFTITIAGDDLIVPNDADQVLRIVIGKSDFQRGTVIQQPISQGVQVVALGGTPVLDAVSRIFKITVTEADFTDAAVEEAIDLFQLPAGAIIQAMKIKHSAAFVGGAISAYTLGVGIAALPEKYLTDFDVFSAPTSTNDSVETSGDEESHDAATPIKVTAKATGGDVADATVGSAEIWVIAVNALSAGSAITTSGLEIQKDGTTVAGGPFSLIDFEGFSDVLKVSDGRGRVIALSAGLTITEGRAPAAIAFSAAAKASVTVKLIVNPNNNDSVIFNTYFNPLGTPTGANPVTVTFKSVLGSPFVAGVSVLDVRIEATIAGTLSNLISGLNDPGLVDGNGDKFSDTWTATNPSSTFLELEQDFTGTGPNGNAGFTLITDTTAGAWEDGAGNPVTPGSPNVNYAGGSNTVDISAIVQAFELELPSGGPSVLIGLDGGFTARVKSGTHEPESAVTITGDAIVASAVFSDAASTTGITYRQITISPTQDAVTGTATVSWTWNGTQFRVLVTKT